MEKENDYNYITLKTVQNRLEENNLEYQIMNLAGDCSILLMRRGGRILGPFQGEQKESILWLNDALSSSNSFKSFLASNNWNIGGDRIWIAPEIQYFVKDISDSGNTWFCPEEIDPGNYTLTHNGNAQYHFSQEMELNAYNFAEGNKDLQLSRHIFPGTDPLAGISSYKSLIEKVKFTGYEQSVALSEKSTDGKMSETWNLVQLKTGGKVFIPVTPKPEFSWYAEPSDPDVLTTHSNCMELDLERGIKYKIGFKSVHITGRIGYLNFNSEGLPYLVIRNFFNNPSSLYLETPMQLKEMTGGHSVHIYNDDGIQGSFGEMECNGQTIGGETGRNSSVDHFALWIYMGEIKKLNEIAQYLLGVNIL